MDSIVPEITIPEEYQSQLRFVPSRDIRSDDKILKSLTQHVPITSERNIWTYWHSGVQNLPAWCKRNIISWHRIHGPDWTIRVLDTVPGSLNHALNWIDAADLPETFVKGTMTGPYVGPHSADFLRGITLWTYGGVWMDVGNILFRNLEDVCWAQLADESSPYTVSTPWMFEQYTANHFVAARKGDEFIRHWHDLFMQLWKNKTSFEGIITDPLISFVSDFKFSEAEARGFAWDFKIDEATVLGYIGQCVAWMRLTWLIEPGPNGFNGVEYWRSKILLFDVAAEDFAAEQIVGYKGRDLFNVFTTPRDGKGADPEWFKVAERTAWRLLTGSTMQKITHGKGLTHSIHCGALMDLKENEGMDCREKTFGELLRFGAVHFEQRREMIEYVEPVMVEEKFVIRKGILEP